MRPPAGFDRPVARERTVRCELEKVGRLGDVDEQIDVTLVGLLQADERATDSQAIRGVPLAEGGHFVSQSICSFPRCVQVGMDLSGRPVRSRALTYSNRTDSRSGIEISVRPVRFGRGAGIGIFYYGVARGSFPGRVAGEDAKGQRGS